MNVPDMPSVHLWYEDHSPSPRPPPSLVMGRWSHPFERFCRQGQQGGLMQACWAGAASSSRHIRNRHVSRSCRKCSVQCSRGRAQSRGTIPPFFHRLSVSWMGCLSQCQMLAWVLRVPRRVKSSPCVQKFKVF